MPLQIVLENVRDIGASPTGRTDQNVFSQVLCCLVALGYQAQQCLIDPSSVGGCESRLRIFIIATAPGYHPPDRPPQIHSFPYGSVLKMERASNGEPFAKLTRDVTPLPFVTLRQAIDDLPFVGDSQPYTCISRPDHRPSRRENDLTRDLISMIPRWPPKSGINDAYHRGTLGKRQREWYTKGRRQLKLHDSRAWTRVDPKSLAPCITTAIQPNDAFTGCCIHWEQDRLLTVMEARRIQGIPDDEVIIGSPAAQWKIIGNGVNRKVAFALGLAIGRTWARYWNDHYHSQEEGDNGTSVQKAILN